MVTLCLLFGHFVTAALFLAAVSGCMTVSARSGEGRWDASVARILLIDRLLCKETVFPLPHTLRGYLCVRHGGFAMLLLISTQGSGVRGYKT